MKQKIKKIFAFIGALLIFSTLAILPGVVLMFVLSMEKGKDIKNENIDK